MMFVCLWRGCTWRGMCVEDIRDALNLVRFLEAVVGERETAPPKRDHLSRQQQLMKSS